jgi:hypothetical protein
VTAPKRRAGAPTATANATQILAAAVETPGRPSLSGGETEAGTWTALVGTVTEEETTGNPSGVGPGPGRVLATVTTTRAEAETMTVVRTGQGTTTAAALTTITGALS